MLPVPFVQTIPKVALEGEDAARDALIDKADAYLEAVKDETTGLLYLTRADRALASGVDELGYLLAAGLMAGDDERAKRAKVATAFERLRFRGTWWRDAKLVVDAYAGGDAKLVLIIGTAQWVWVQGDDVDPTFRWAVWGDAGEPEVIELESAQWAWANGGEPVSYRWAVWSEDLTDDFGIDWRSHGGLLSSDDDFGIDWQDGTEGGFSNGSILFDVDNAVLTAEQVAALKIALLDCVPGYFQVTLGYMDGPFFTEYAGGVIN